MEIFIQNGKKLEGHTKSENTQFPYLLEQVKTFTKEFPLSDAYKNDADHEAIDAEPVTLRRRINSKMTRTYLWFGKINSNRAISGYGLKLEILD